MKQATSILTARLSLSVGCVLVVTFSGFASELAFQSEWPRNAVGIWVGPE